MIICDFNNQMHLHFSSFVWNAAQTTSWSGLSDRLECVLEGMYLVFSGPDRYPIRKTREVPIFYHRKKYYLYYVFFLPNLQHREMQWVCTLNIPQHIKRINTLTLDMKSKQTCFQKQQQRLSIYSCLKEIFSNSCINSIQDYHCVLTSVFMTVEWLTTWLLVIYFAPPPNIWFDYWHDLKILIWGTPLVKIYIK